MSRNILLLLLTLLLSQTLRAQQAGEVLAECRTAAEQKQRMSRYFTQREIPDNVFCRMQGKSFGKGCTTPRSALRYLVVLHRNKDGRTQVGEMVCHKNIASKLLGIFRELYEKDYRIERMILIDDYDADDQRSMAANNTTCFNFRRQTGSGTKVSKHALGLAVDINPLYNPYVKGTVVQPTEGRPYINDRERIPMAVKRGDLCHRLFMQHGFRWGGAWKSLKDYQHFEF